MKAIRTLGELKKSGYRVFPVRQEMRKNLLNLLKRNEHLLPGMVGYGTTVIPEIENAILAGHNVVFLGERGQGKSRMIRGLVSLLDEYAPVVLGCEINDNPFAPICSECKSKLNEKQGGLEIGWIDRERRYGEKLATPDVSMADLVGEIDPVKVAEGRYLSDESTIHYGLIPRSNRGIFAINELPDLPEKVQVGLFNLMEERDVQIKGYKIRLPLDIVIMASANPEDYTSRGRIITPLKDRFDAQVRTHYPASVEDEIRIMEQERARGNIEERSARVPEFMKQIVAEITMEARRCHEINQSSGVSVRVSISNYEALISNAEKRSVRLGEKDVVPRVSDLHAVYPTTAGKIELEYTGQDGKEEEVIERLINRSVLKVFDRNVQIGSLDSIVQYFASGWGVEVSDEMPAQDYLEGVEGIPGMKDAISKWGQKEPAFLASAVEFILEGLHLHQKLNKEVRGGRWTFRAKKL